MTAGLSASQNRHGCSVALLIPTLGPVPIRAHFPLRTWREAQPDPGVKEAEAIVGQEIASAAPTFPGPEASGRR